MTQTTAHDAVDDALAAAANSRAAVIAAAQRAANAANADGRLALNSRIDAADAWRAVASAIAWRKAAKAAERAALAAEHAAAIS